MRFIIMHKTNAQWEADAIPSKELVATVGGLLGEMTRAGVLLSGEGLRATSHGVRLNFSDGKRTITRGPYQGTREIPAVFSILNVESIDEAVDWASRSVEGVDDVEIDIRPVTEPWDIGMAPKPEGRKTTRYMALRKANDAYEAGTPPSPKQKAAMARLIDETTRSGVHLVTEKLEPSSKGRRYRVTQGKLSITDGPFAESKEMIAGYVLFRANSLEEAAEWAPRYAVAVDCHELDLRQVADEL
ncbi:MAG: YciI family protein [Myxococcota bacterium]